MSFEKEKQEIIFWGTQLYNRGLTYGPSGNISMKIGEKLLVTAHESYLGFLHEDDILVMDGEGALLEGNKEPTSEKSFHVSIYKQFPGKKAAIHAHSPHTTHYFHYHDDLIPITLEERMYLGKIDAIIQKTPTITELASVYQALESNDIVVIKDHGVVAIGEDLQYAFSLIELLEINARLHLVTAGSSIHEEKKPELKEGAKKYKFFSSEHVAGLKEVINNDERAQSLGKEYDLTTVICTKVTDGEEVFSFRYEQGKIIEVNYSEENADFVFSAARKVWGKIFSGELDPFVAKTQGKIKLKGDFTLLSRWFPVFERTFALWKELPLEPL
jgi:L-fuculose-phosphate aldolase